MNEKTERKVKGLFRRRGSPHWWIRYSDRHGRIRRESTGTTQKKLAETILAKRRTLVAENRALDVRKIPKTTFFELCAQYWEIRGQHLRMKGLASMIETWRGGLGNVALRALTAQRIEQFLNDRMEEEELTAATRNRHLTMLRALFNRSIEWGMLYENPTAGINLLRETGARTRFLDQDEIKRLLAAASNLKIADKRFRAILVTALHTGMRRGELLALRWGDVDFRNRIITVQESKSGKKRTIPMDETLVATLRKLPSRLKRTYVFPTPWKSGGPLTDLNHTFRRVADKAKIDNVRFHDLRHTFASHLVMNGVDIKTVQELLGHHSLTMTMRYSHLAPVHRAQAVRVLDVAFRSDTKTDTVRKRRRAGSVSR